MEVDWKEKADTHLKLGVGFKLPSQEDVSPPGIASKGRGTGLLLDLFSRDGNSFGFYGEDEAGACSEGEGEGSTLAGQSVA